jgi:hypothetical protein
VKDVILSVSRFNENTWPEDEIWNKILPAWFLTKIKSHSIDEIKRNENIWEYGSWLDAMKFRGWYWYSSEVGVGKFKIILVAQTFPYSVNPLEFVVLETGVDLRNISFEEHMSNQ